MINNEISLYQIRLSGYFRSSGSDYQIRLSRYSRVSRFDLWISDSVIRSSRIPVLYFRYNVRSILNKYVRWTLQSTFQREKLSKMQLNKGKFYIYICELTCSWKKRKYKIFLFLIFSALKACLLASPLICSALSFLKRYYFLTMATKLDFKIKFSVQIKSTPHSNLKYVTARTKYTRHPTYTN